MSDLLFLSLGDLVWPERDGDLSSDLGSGRSLSLHEIFL